MRLSDLRVLLKHASAMGSVQILHPDNRRLDVQLWLLVRWAHTEEKFS
jgi:hypothetical protein